MSEREVYHVTPHERGWQVKKEGATQASSVHDTKEEAVERAKELAKSAPKGQVKVHKADGTFQTEYTYGDDPTSSKG